MTQTTDAALVERLRARSDDDAEYGWRSRAEEYAQAADTIEAQARRIEALEDKRAWAEHFASTANPSCDLKTNPLYSGDPAWTIAEWAMRFVMKGRGL